MNEEIKVSVCVVTYNQEDYIAECLQSLVDQVADFKFEIIVGEDCSTDNTRKIVSDFCDKYPDVLVKNFHSENVGAVKNVISTYKMAKGKYICHVDGDDYALPGKLQVQFDALEKNPDCVICSHDVFLVNDKGKQLSATFRKHSKKINTLMDLYAQLPFFAHSSKMFRNDLNDKYWDELHPESLDIEIHVQQAKKGNIYHVLEPIGVYRLSTGISSVQTGVNPLLPNGTRRIYDAALQECKSNKEKKLIKGLYAKALLNYAYQSLLVEDIKGFKEYINSSINMKIISATQVLMFFSGFFPLFSFAISKARKNYKYKS